MSGPSVATSSAVGKCDPVCQLFVNGFGKRSRYTFTNFPSLFAPKEARACTYLVALIDADGNEVENTEVVLDPFGTVDFVPAERFSGPLPELGLVTCELADWAEPAYQMLGVLRPYFYAVFHDDGFGSIAVVHPQTTLIDTAPAGASWRSSHVVRTGDITHLEVLQINPLAEARDTSVSLCDLDGTSHSVSAARMGPRSVRRICWPADALQDSEFVCLAADPMTAPNAKPLMFQHHNGGFSASHS